MAYLSKCGVVQGVITEDSDVLVYGASKVFTKIDIDHGTAQLVEANRLDECFDIENWSMAKFRHLCVLAGCDYLPSIPGIGIIRAREFVAKIKDADIFKAVSRMGLYLGRSIEIPQEYVSNFKKAVDTFKYHLVFDIESRKTVPINDYEDGSSHVNMPFAGNMLDSDVAFDLAIGNRSTSTLEVINNYTPPALYNKVAAPELVATIQEIGESLKWTIPSCPVITLNLTRVKFSTANNELYQGLGNGMIQTSDHRLLLSSDMQITCNKHCKIQVDNNEYVLLWKWDFTGDIYDLDSFGSLTVSDESSYDPSESLFSDYSHENISEDEQEEIIHTLPFKVMGSGYSQQVQQTLEQGHVRLSSGETVNVKLRPDPDNEFDKEAIAVDFDVGFGFVEVGFIQKELTKYIHPLLHSNKIKM
ncbi:uncharacterized protein [Ptychodera flava]